MRHGFLVLLLWTAVVQQGCAAPRAVWLAGRASDQVPLPPNGTYTDFDVYPSVCTASPGAALKIHSPLPPEESLQWYDKELKSLGWRFHLDHVDHEGNQWKTYHRDFHLGDSAIRLGSESIGVEALPGENGSVIRVAMSGFYYWDLPSRATFLPFYMDEGPVTLFLPSSFGGSDAASGKVRVRTLPQGMLSMSDSADKPSRAAWNWDAVQRAVGYKRDLFSHDLICIELLFDDGTTRVLDEESESFVDLMLEMNRTLPGVPQEWYSDIMVPAFQAMPTILFQRRRRAD